MHRLILICIFCLVQTAAVFSQNPEKYLVGSVLPLSGDIASWGENVRRGIELARREIPHLEVRYEDETFCKSALALSGAQSLIRNKEVQVIITGCLNGTKVMTPLAQRKNLLLISSGLLSGDEKDTETPYLLSLSGQIFTEGRALANLISSQGFSRLAFIRSEDEFTGAVLRALESSAVRPSIIDLPIRADSYDFTPLLLRARRQKADALLIYLGERQTLRVMRIREELGLKLPVFSGYIIESNAFDGKDIRRWLEGIVYTHPKLAEQKNPERVQFETLYRQQYGTQDQPSSNSYFVYDGMKVLGSALQHCQSSAPACIRKFFITQGPFQGVSGKFHYNEKGFVERAFETKVIRGGKFSVLAGERKDLR